MRFSSRRARERDEVLELVRGELAATRTQLHAMVGETIAQLDERLRAEHRQREQFGPALVATLEEIRRHLVTCDVNLVDTLRQLGSSYVLVAQQIEGDRLERSAFVETLGRLAGHQQGVAEPSLPAHSVVGGSFMPDLLRLHGNGEDGETAPARELDRERGEPLDAVEVRCRFGDRWAAGFEVCEIVADPDGPARYRLRRRSDGSVLPQLFDPGDVRPADAGPLVTQ